MRIVYISLLLLFLGCKKEGARPSVYDLPNGWAWLQTPGKATALRDGKPWEGRAYAGTFSRGGETHYSDTTPSTASANPFSVVSAATAWTAIPHRVRAAAVVCPMATVF